MPTDPAPSQPSMTRQPCASLEEVRLRIDEIDDRIIDLIAQRAGYVAQAALFKDEPHEAPSLDRVQAVLERIKARAAAAGLDAHVAEATYRAMIFAFIDWEAPQIGAHT